MSFLNYLLEVNVYILIFYGFYYLLLRSETFNSVNRYFLIVSTITAFLMPFLQIGALHNFYTSGDEGTFIESSFRDPRMFTAVPYKAKGWVQYYTPLIWLYAAGVMIFLFHLFVNIWGIVRLIMRANRIKEGKVTFISLRESDEKAFSFFNFLFIHTDLEEKQTVIDHELVHIHQKHSIDILLFEIVQAICWFNPIAYFLKKDIRLVHEYLADDKATQTSLGKHAYALFLIRNSFGLPSHRITSQFFNQSILKRRINMLNKRKSSARARLRLLLLLPLSAAMVSIGTMSFKKDYSLVDLYPEKYSANELNNQVQTKPQPASKTDYFAPYTVDPTTKAKVPSEKKLIVINGKIMNNKEVANVMHIDKMVTLRPAEAVKKYGNRASAGAYEFTGNKITVSAKVMLPPPPPVERREVKFPPPIVKRDQVKFPPPIVKPDAPGTFYARIKRDSKTKKYASAENRVIIINGEKLEDVSDFAGVSDATTVKLKGPDAASKYGTVIITGNNVKVLKISDAPALPPPPPRRSQIKFPPPTVIPDKGSFFANWKYDETAGKLVSVEKRLILINGEKISDLSDFGGVTGATTIELKGPESSKEYGEAAKFGVVEIKGDNIQILKSNQVPPPPPMDPAGPPPPPKRSQVKFPPPIIKKDQVKFPPPIVKPDKVKSKKGN